MDKDIFEKECFSADVLEILKKFEDGETNTVARQESAEGAEGTEEDENSILADILNDLGLSTDELDDLPSDEDIQADIALMDIEDESAAVSEEWKAEEEILQILINFLLAEELNEDVVKDIVRLCREDRDRALALMVFMLQNKHATHEEILAGFLKILAKR